MFVICIKPLLLRLFLLLSCPVFTVGRLFWKTFALSSLVLEEFLMTSSACWYFFTRRNMYMATNKKLTTIVLSAEIFLVINGWLMRSSKSLEHCSSLLLATSSSSLFIFSNLRSFSRRMNSFLGRSSQQLNEIIILCPFLHT